jgi:H+/Cl- antiporter ClcA
MSNENNATAENDAPTARFAAPDPLRWFAAIVLTGVGAGLGGMLLALLLHFIQHVAYGYSLSKIISAETFLEGTAAASPARRVAVLGVCGLVAGFGWLIVGRMRPPLVGIARAVRSDDPHLPVASTLVHALLQIVTVALGSPLGREVAPREVGATVAGVLARCGRLSVERRRIIVACGAGAGLAAVYNVPLGGAMFALEGLLGTFGWAALVPAVATSVIATMIARIGLGDFSQYTVPHFDVTRSLVAWSIVMGPIAGTAAYGFARMTSSARKNAPHGWRLPVLCLLNFLLIGVLSIWFPQLLGNGKGPAQVGFDNQLAVQLAAALLVLKLAIAWGSLRAGAQGGLLTPALCCGALLAIVAGGAWTLVWPGTPSGAFAIVGAAAFLAASMQVPLTAVVLIVEFTRVSEGFLVPILLAVAGSIAVYAWWSRVADAAQARAIAAHR